MVTLLTVLFVIFSMVLAFFILIQPGKGDMGLGGGMGNQMLFGGSGGQSFFQKTTWILCAVFILGALGLSILKTRERRASMLEGFRVAQKTPVAPAAPEQTAAADVTSLADTAVSDDAVDADDLGEKSE